LIFEEGGDTMELLSAGGELLFTSDNGVSMILARFERGGITFEATLPIYIGTEVSLQPQTAGILEQVYGTTAQITRGYRTFTNSTNYERWALQSGAGYFELAAETAGTGTDNIDVRLTPAGTGAAKVMAASGVSANIKYATTLLSALSGATVTATNLVPDGAFVLGVVTRITTTFGATGGTTGYQVGDGTDADRWGAIAAITAGTTSSNADATAAFTGSFTAANNVVITAVGGNFDGTGALRVTICYIDLTPPTS
jgi:hypothetical protein